MGSAAALDSDASATTRRHSVLIMDPAPRGTDGGKLGVGFDGRVSFCGVPYSMSFPESTSMRMLLLSVLIRGDAAADASRVTTSAMQFPWRHFGGGARAARCKHNR